MNKINNMSLNEGITYRSNTNKNGLPDGIPASLAHTTNSSSTTNSIIISNAISSNNNTAINTILTNSTTTTIHDISNMSTTMDDHDANDKEYLYKKKKNRLKHGSSYKVLFHPYRIMGYLRNVIWRCRRKMVVHLPSTTMTTSSSQRNVKVHLTILLPGLIAFLLLSTRILRLWKNVHDGTMYSHQYQTNKRSLIITRSKYVTHQHGSIPWILRFTDSSSTSTPFEFNEWGNDLITMKPDYGDLKLTFLENESDAHLKHATATTTTTTTTTTTFTRQLKPEPDQRHGHVWTKDEYEPDAKYFDTYYAFDDDDVRNIPFREVHRKCRRTSFHKLYFPNCNLFHEMPMQMGELLGEGAYRAAFLLQERYDPEIVVKVNRFHGNPFEYDRYEFVRMDALVMERLTASPRIVDMYGHCATSVNTEFLPDELEPLLIPGDGDGDYLEDKEDVDPQNDFTITQKLEYALQMAESIADLHGFKDGVLVHDDIQTLQFLFAPDGRLKLNDFNRAEAMLFDEETGEYCRYQNGAGGGDYRAPEEYVDGRLNEKIDVFSYGNNIYCLLTGLWNFYEEKKVQKKIEKIKAGEIPYIDPRYRNRNYIQDRLIYVMEQCWKFEPDERADIFWVVKYLRETKQQATKMGFYDEEFVHLHFQDWPVDPMKDKY